MRLHPNRSIRRQIRHAWIVPRWMWIANVRTVRRNNFIACAVLLVLFGVVGPIYAILLPVLPTDAMPESSCENVAGKRVGLEHQIVYETRHTFGYPTVWFQPGSVSDGFGIVRADPLRTQFREAFTFVAGPTCIELTFRVRNQSAADCTITVDGVVMADEAATSYREAAVAFCVVSLQSLPSR